MKRRAPTRGTSLLALAVSVAFFVLFSYLARWTTFDCVGDVCTYESRRVLTLPFLHRRTVSRRALAEHPERVSVELVDRKGRGADLVVGVDGERFRVEEGDEPAMRPRVEAFRSELSDPTKPIHASVSPHPFGFLMLGLLPLLIVGAALQVRETWGRRRIRRRRWRRPGSFLRPRSPDQGASSQARRSSAKAGPSVTVTMWPLST